MLTLFGGFVRLRELEKLYMEEEEEEEEDVNEYLP